MTCVSTALSVSEQLFVRRHAPNTDHNVGGYSELSIFTEKDASKHTSSPISTKVSDELRQRRARPHVKTIAHRVELCSNVARWKMRQVCHFLLELARFIPSGKAGKYSHILVWESRRQYLYASSHTGTIFETPKARMLPKVVCRPPKTANELWIARRRMARSTL